MILLSIRDLYRSFGVNEVLRGVSLTLQTNERMGLVGVNGCGKTTLMRVIAGLEEYDEGELHLNRNTRIGYMAQQADFEGTNTVYEAMARVFEDVQAMEARMRELEHGMAVSEHDSDDLMNEYARLRDRFEAADGYAWRSRVAGVLTGLKFSKDRYDQPIHQLSGGERTRLGLARLLLQSPDLLLLDEPTNHLDLESLAWLEEYLTAYKGTVLIISHDRYFMDHVCTCMAELLLGRVDQYSGNYSQFIRRREEAFEIRMKAYTLQQREIARQQEIIARYRSFNREKSIKAAESREKALARIQRLERPEDEKQVRFRFEARRRTGEDVLTLDRLAKAYEGRVLFRELSLRVRAGDRIAIIGPNGIGKSTLLKCVTGEVAADAGAIRWGTNVDMGYYDQHQRALHDDKLVIDEIWDDFPALEQHEVRGALGLFLFLGDDVFMPVSTLSGGERGRLALTRLMLKRDNLLLLDEPTNHLDMESREVLENALDAFTGTIIAVSHDRYFINRFATRVVSMSAEGVTEYIGNYDDYMDKISRPQAPDDEPAGRTRTELIKARKKERALLMDQRAAREAVDALEREIEAGEQEIRRLEKQLADPALYADAERARQTALEHKEALARVARLYDRWTQAAETLDE